jgi:hypothetical protein
VRTVKGIRKESKKRTEGVFCTPERKRAQKPERNVISDKCDLCMVQRKENFSSLCKTPSNNKRKSKFSWWSSV